MKLRSSSDVMSVAVVAFLTVLRGLLVATQASFNLLFVALVLVLLGLTWTIKHNAIHVPIWSGETANRIFSIFLTANTGTSTANTALVHNDIHHVHDNGPEDWTRLSLVEHIKSPLLRAVSYPFAVIRSIGVNRRGYLQSRPDLARRIRSENAIVLAVIVLAVVWSPRAGLSYLVAPMVVGQLMLVMVNFLEHLGCDTGEANDVTHPFVNKLLFNVGHHSEHHAYPARHWSELGRGAFAERTEHPSA